MMSDISDKLEEKELHSAGVNVPIDEMAPNDSLISTGGIQDSLVQLRELCAKLKGAGLDVYNVCFSNGQIDDTPHEFPEGERALYWVGNRKFSDCSLKYSEEVDPIPAHRIYLTRRSEFFRAMFGVNRAGKWYEGAAEFPIVDLSLPDSQSFLVMLKYLYTGEIYVLKDDCANARGFCGVLANSEYLLVDGLSEELYKENRFGDNTCFMNVVIQALWHIRSFRERFYSLNYTHTHKRTPCVYCSLLHVFTHYKFAEDKIAPPRQLREALAKLSQRESYEYSFNLGALCDAEECLDAILKWFHCDQVGLKSLKRYKDTGCSPECISHASFGAEICDIRICTEPKCRGSNEPLPIQSFIYRVFVMEVLSVTPPRRAKSPFAYQLFQAYRHQEYSCPVDGIKCPKGSARVERWCLKVPEVFTMSLIWPPIVKKHLLSKMLHALDLKINLRHFFSVHANQMSTSFELVGMILFEGMGHYVSIYFGERQNAWLLFDDTSVRVLGDFDAVIKKCLERMLRPTVLFFERDVIRSKIWDSSLQLAKTMESPLPAIFSSSSEVRESDRITPQTVSPSFMDGWAKQSKDGKVTRTTMLKWASKVTDGGPTEELRNTLSKCEAMKELSGEEITMFVKKNGDSVLRLLDAHTVYEALATRPVPDVVRRCTVCSLDIPMKYQHQIKCLRTHTGGAINSSISNCCVARASTCYSRAHKFQ
eukprot:182246_1